MKIDDDVLIAYAMGTLLPEEEREVVLFLRRNPEAAARAQSYFDTLTDFALSNEPEALPEDAEDRLLARIRGTAEVDARTPAAPVETTMLPPRKPPRRAWWVGLAAAAAILAFAWFGVFQGDVGVWQAERQLQSICAQPGASCVTLRDDDDEAIGTLARRPDDSLLVVLAHHPPRDRVYQAWEIVEGTPRSLGTWRARVIDVDAPLAPESVFGITVEPPSGSEAPTTAPFVVVPVTG